MMKRTVLATVALGALLTAAVPVFAQGGPGLAPGGDGRGPRMERMMERMCEDRDARVAGALAFAETRLKITDAQRPAWNKLVTAVKSSSGAMEKMCADPAKMKPPATLPERAQRMEEMTAMRLEQIRQVRPALDEVYATFTDGPEEDRRRDGRALHAARSGRAWRLG